MSYIIFKGKKIEIDDILRLSGGTNEDFSELKGLKDLEDIKKLILTNNKIKSLPTPIGNYKSLTHLWLEYNDIENLPDFIGNFTRLKELTISNTPVKNLPSSIENLKSLRKLTLTKTNIEEFPESIGNLKSIYRIWIIDTPLKQLPNSIGNLKKLWGLVIRDAPLSFLPDSIGDLDAMRELVINKTLLKELPESIGNLKSIRKMDLRYNQLTSIPESINNITTLISLDLRRNYLKVRPKKKRGRKISFLPQNDTESSKKVVSNILDKAITKTKISFLPQNDIESSKKVASNILDKAITNTKISKEFLLKIDEKSDPDREFSGKELREFPENVEGIKEKSIKYDVKRTLFKNKNIIVKNFDKAPQFGNYIVDYGIYLLENGDLVEAGLILSTANGSENFDNMWPYALFHKARIAAILEEFDFMIEFLRRSFRAAEAHKDVCGGDRKLKRMVEIYYEFRRYRSHPRFKQLLTHNFNNKKDLDEYWAAEWY